MIRCRQRKEEEEEEEKLTGADVEDQLAESDISADRETIDLKVSSNAVPVADVVVSFEAPDGFPS